MSVITEVVNPATEKTDLKAKGTIKRVFIKRINADGSAKETPIKNGPNKGKVIKATHRYSIIVTADGDDEFIGFGEGEVKNLKYEDQFQVKQEDGTYKDLVAGQEISIYPVDKRTYEKDGETKVAYQAKRKNLRILKDAPAGSSPAATPAKAGGNNTQKDGSVKIFGEITNIVGNIVTVQDEKLGAGDLVLTDDQLAQVKVGGRMGALVLNGELVGGFRAYGPAGQSGGSKRKSNYDPTGVETGHAINALGILLSRGFKVKDELETAKLLHTVTVEVKAAEAQRLGKDPDAVGASAGNAVLNGCRRVDLKTKDLAGDIAKIAKGVLENLADPLYAFISGAGKTTADAVKEPLDNAPKAPDLPATGEYDPPLDFDDDIPFAPIGLQYGISLLHAMP